MAFRKWFKSTISRRGATPIGNDPTDLPFNKLTEAFDFEQRRLVTEGHFGKVYKIQRNTTGEYYTLKEVPKEILSNPYVKTNIERERICLKRFDSPFIIKLHNTYESPDALYFLLDMASNGNLFDVNLRNNKPMKLSCVQFAAAEVLMGLEYLRSQGFIHRDLKAANVLVDCNSHCKLSSFGSAKMIGQAQGLSLANTAMRNSEMGIAEIMAPEVLLRQKVSFGTDYWNLGFLIFFLYTMDQLADLNNMGKNMYFAFIEEMRWKYPFDHPDPELHDLVLYLTRYMPRDRIGTLDIQEIKEHPFFRHVDFATLHHSVSPGFIETDEDNRGSCAARDVPIMTLPSRPAQAAAQASNQPPPPFSASAPQPRTPPPHLRGPHPMQLFRESNLPRVSSSESSDGSTPSPDDPHSRRRFRGRVVSEEPNQGREFLPERYLPRYSRLFPQEEEKEEEEISPPPEYSSPVAEEAVDSERPPPPTYSGPTAAHWTITRSTTQQNSAPTFIYSTEYSAPTVPQQNVVPPNLSRPSRRAQAAGPGPRINPFSLLGPAAPAPPSMLQSAPTQPSMLQAAGRPSAGATPTLRGPAPQVMAPVLSELNDLFTRVRSPPPDDETEEVAEAEGEEDDQQEPSQ